MNSYCLVGKVPPPIGGVTVYVKRRLQALQNIGSSVKFVSLSDPLALLFLPFKSFSTIEVNSVNLSVVLYFFISFQISRCKFVDHNGSRNYSGFKKQLFNWLVKKSQGVLIVNKKLELNYSKGTNIEIICPFIPPQLGDEALILESYPREVKELIAKKRFFVNSAWKYIPYMESDLYGITDSLMLLDRFEDAVMLLAIAEFDSENIPKQIQAQMNRLISLKRLFLLVGQKELWPVFKASELSLRLTPTDGDSVSVREALYFNCKVLASNAIERPANCHVYNYEDKNDLIIKFKGLYK